MKDKLLKLKSNKWYRLDDRPDREQVTQVINELIEIGYKFVFSYDGEKFMRRRIDLFEWAAENPDKCEIKTRTVGGKKVEDLYKDGKLIAIR